MTPEADDNIEDGQVDERNDPGEDKLGNKLYITTSPQPDWQKDLFAVKAKFLGYEGVVIIIVRIKFERSQAEIQNLSPLRLTFLKSR